MDTNWYVVHTYSGYENKVKTNIDKIRENRNLQEQIVEVRVPMYDVTEVKKGVSTESPKKLFPGYVLINMNMNDETWYVVRNTRGVTGFVGPGSKPVPLTENEMKFLGMKKEVITEFDVDDVVKVIDGSWVGNDGVVKKVNHNKKSVEVYLEAFGRKTLVEIDFKDVKKM